MKNLTNKKEALLYLEEGRLLHGLNDLSEDLQNDPEVIFAYARKWSTTAYRDKKEFFRSSRENMKELLKTNISLELLEDKDLEDPEYMKIAIMSKPDRLRQLFWSSHNGVLKKTIDKEMALYLFRKEGINLRYLPSFQNDEDVVFEAICEDVRSIHYASPRIQCFFGDMVFVDEMKLQDSIQFIKEKIDQIRQLQAKIDFYLQQEDLKYLLQQMSILTEEVELEVQGIAEAKQKVKQKMKDGIISYHGEILYKK